MSRDFEMTPAQIDKLDELESTARFTQRNDTPEKGQRLCELIDKNRKTAWAEGFANDNATALDNALADAEKKLRPMSPMEQAQHVAATVSDENKKLAAENARLKAELEANKPKRGRPPKSESDKAPDETPKAPAETPKINMRGSTPPAPRGVTAPKSPPPDDPPEDDSDDE